MRSGKNWRRGKVDARPLGPRIRLPALERQIVIFGFFRKAELNNQEDLYPAANSRSKLLAPAITGDFSTTMDKVLRKWGSNPPRPEDVFPLLGNIELWSGHPFDDDTPDDEKS